jgi:hypothetical protein
MIILPIEEVAIDPSKPLAKQEHMVTATLHGGGTFKRNEMATAAIFGSDVRAALEEAGLNSKGRPVDPFAGSKGVRYSEQ